MEPDRIILENVSKFYGEVLGVNRVSLSVGPGITSLVGPNGSGKTTLMNLITGLIRPSKGRLQVLGIEPRDSRRLFSRLGYCSQFDAFPRGLSGIRFIRSLLEVHGFSVAEAEQRAWKALERVRLVEAARRAVGGYSKGMRQRIRLAQALAHDPQVLILDEPLNGLDPMARSEMIALFRELAAEGRTLIVSSHILHELDLISDRVVLLNGGYVVADGDIQGVRSEIPEHPVQVFIRCSEPAVLASKLFQMDHIVEVRLHGDRGGLLVRTTNAEQFHLILNRTVLDAGLEIQHLAPADEDVDSVYQYLIGPDGGSL